MLPPYFKVNRNLPVSGNDIAPISNWFIFKNIKININRLNYDKSGIGY